jgi:hypothetical protein
MAAERRLQPNFAFRHPEMKSRVFIVNIASTFRIVVISSLIALVCVVVGALSFCFMGIDPSTLVLPSVDDAATERHVRDFCGACHVVPRPDLLPRKSWPDEIAKAYDRYNDSGRKDLKVPNQTIITKYFSRLAPMALNIPSAPDSSASPVPFRTEFIDFPDEYISAAVSFLNLVPSRSRPKGTASDLLLCDMGNGLLNRFAWNDGKMSSSTLAKLNHPAHVVPCDFDRDGHQDFLVADLGMLKPSDELQGSVVLLRSLGEGERYDVITVLDGVGRVADAELADLDGDGDFDFVVAEFGYEKVGRLVWLETLEITDGRPRTELHVIDSRHGSIHAPPTDIDGDGDLDLIVLIGQEHETIVAFLNDGHGHFEPRTLFQADSPSFGSSGLELVDLDADGDLDILFTNGDTLDTMQIKPFHGVNWLENTGSCQFEYHRLTELPGAVRAVAGDFDGDGDLDIAAVAFCPPILRNQMRPGILDTIIWLEQTSPGEFERHSLERSTIGAMATAAGYMAITAGDFDGDNDLDLAVGEFAPFEVRPAPGTVAHPRRWLTIYWNEATSKKEVAAAALKVENSFQVQRD